MSDRLKKKPSSSEYRKRKAAKEKEFQQVKKFMNLDKYIETKQQNEDNLERDIASSSTASTSVIEPCTDLQGIIETKSCDKLSNESEISQDLVPISELPYNHDAQLSFSGITNAPLEFKTVDSSDVGT